MCRSEKFCIVHQLSNNFTCQKQAWSWIHMTALHILLWVLETDRYVHIQFTTAEIRIPANVQQFQRHIFFYISILSFW